LLPPSNEDYKFLQIYFVGNSAIELDQRCAIFDANKREIIRQLQNLLHERNELVRFFKTSLNTMRSEDHKIIIRADKRPYGSHARQFNAPTGNEFAVVIVGENVVYALLFSSVGMVDNCSACMRLIGHIMHFNTR